MGSRTRPHALGYGVAAGLATWLAAAPLHAQTPPQPRAEVEEEEIVITGSRIKKDEFTSAAPVQVITRERTVLEGVTDQAEAIQSTSTAAGSGQINSTFTGFVVDGGPGVNTVSLRGLGAQRSLVLLNGRRLPPAGTGGTVGPVDLNILPNSVINRVEILKDGASSIYGSDAVAGVVNVITRQRLEGGRVGATANVLPAGGDEYQVEGGYGWTFDNASLSVSGEFYRRKELEYGDRDFLSCTQDYTFALANGMLPATPGYNLPAVAVQAGGRADSIDPRTGRFKCFNHGVSGYLQTFDLGFNLASRIIAPPIPGLPTTAGIALNNPLPGWRFIPLQERTFDDPRQLNASVVSPTDRYSVFVQGDWRPDGLGGAELYTEILANRRESSQDDFRQFFPWVALDSSLNPLDINVVGPALTRDLRPIILVPSNSEQTVDVLRALAGVRGDFGSSSWSYDVYASHSTSDGDYNDDVIPLDRLVAGTGTFQSGSPFESFSTPDGVCPPTAPAGCVPFRGLITAAGLVGQFSPAEQAYFFAQDRGNTKFDQTIIEAQFTGDLFELPAGTLAAAGGISYRKDKIDDVPGEFSINRNSWARITAGRTAGSDTLYEAYAEVEIPLLRGKTGFKDLSLNLSGRYSDYDSVGDATTYKVGLNWVINDWVRVRSTYGTSFRAPALYELFLEDQTSFLSQQAVDPCIRWGDPDAPARPVIQRNCQAAGITDPLFAGGSTSALITTGGGLGRLKPEDSDSLSVGLVLTPPDWGFSAAVDYFDITVDNQITRLAAAVVGACYAFEPFPTPGFCDLFTRGTDLGIETIDASYRNVPSQSTSGIDITLAYEKDFTFGSLSIDSQITYTETDETELFPGRSFLPNGTIGEPEWVGSVQTRFERGDWTFAWTLNYTGKGDQLGYEGEDGFVAANNFSPAATNITSVDAFVTNDFTVRYQSDKWEAIVGVTNFLNEKPPIVSLGDDAGSVQRIGNAPLSSQYFSGYLGRSLFLNLEYEF
jgi:iron complex outermembrane recepter protein